MRKNVMIILKLEMEEIQRPNKLAFYVVIKSRMISYPLETNYTLSFSQIPPNIKLDLLRHLQMVKNLSQFSYECKSFANDFGNGKFLSKSSSNF